MTLAFSPVCLEDRETLERYLIPFGENSCQHSFVNMYSLQEKYGDSFCEADGVLYLLRANRCTADYRVYLAPMGAGDRKAAYARLLEDAHAHGARLRLETVTEREAEFLAAAFPDRFEIEARRDYAEYIYLTERMRNLPGNKLMKKRRELHQYQREYGDRTDISMITRADFPELLAFEREWLEQSAEDHDMVSLEREYRCMERQLDHYEVLGICGIILRIDGQVKGFSYGSPLNGECFDALVEKGDRTVRNIYRILFQASVRLCAAGLKYVNREEDVGSPGLRMVKTAYIPDVLMKKYLVTEK